MSTRANIAIKGDFDDVIYFYRHSDGYPEGTLPTLKTFLKWRKEGKISENVEQSSGWLILLGNQEYGSPESPDDDWKVGAYEPSTGIHGDIEFLYLIDLETIKMYYTQQVEVNSIEEVDSEEWVEVE